MARLPKPRGPLSEEAFAALADGGETPPVGRVDGTDVEDNALTLWTLYELSYRGYDEVDDDREWDPGVVALRRELERLLEERLRARWPGPPAYDRATPFPDAFLAAMEDHEGPRLARFVETEASVDQVLEFLQLRSLYHLKESDPVSWTIPRLPVGSRAGLMELQYDEYGCGRPERLHAQLFAEGLAAVGLDPGEGAYVDQAPLEIFEQNNAMSLFGINRRLRGAALGHLAAFEATSSGPSRRIAGGMARLEMAAEMRGYYEEHVEADAVHEQLAARTICGSLLEAEPELEDDVWFGAFACVDGEDRVGALLLGHWDER